MKKYVVTKKVALLAKEAGFNQPCIWAYSHNEGSKPIEYTEVPSEYRDKFFTPAPFTFQLQDWLRDELRADIVIHPVWRSEGRYYATLPSFVFGTKCTDNFDGYHTALVAGLALALENIQTHEEIKQLKINGWESKTTLSQIN